MRCVCVQVAKSVEKLSAAGRLVDGEHFGSVEVDGVEVVNYFLKAMRFATDLQQQLNPMFGCSVL